MEDRTLRSILHLDMNSYFATVEQQANPYLRGRPVGIIKAEGRGCVIAASVEAKKFGVGTGSTVWEAKKKCPGIVFVPSDMEKYFSQTEKMIKIVTAFSPIVEVFSIDEVFLDVTDSRRVFAGGELQMVLEMKEQIRQQLGEWVKCSVGVSFNKITAKLASGMQKPDGLVFLTPENYLQETEKIKTEEVCGIGRSRTKYLENIGVTTLGQARKIPNLPEEIRKLVWLEGEASLQTIEELEPAKSVSRTYTTYRELNSKQAVLRLVRNLVEEAASKLREMGLGGRTVCLILTTSLRESSFWARKTIKNPTGDPQIIFDLLWREYEKNPLPGVRFAGVGISNLTENCQLPIVDSRQKLLGAVDKVNDRFGLFTLYPAELLGGELIRPEVTGFLGDKWYRFGGRAQTK